MLRKNFSVSLHCLNCLPRPIYAKYWLHSPRMAAQEACLREITLSDMMIVDLDTSRWTYYPPMEDRP